MTKSETRRDVTDEPTLEDHPGLDNDEVTDAGKMMTASGSTGPATDQGDAATKKAARASSEKAGRRQNARRETSG